MSVTAVQSAEGELRYRHSSAPGSCSCCTHSNRSGPHRAPPPPVAALELLSLLPVLLCVQQPQLPLGAQLACTRKHTELLWRLLLVLSVLLCVKQPQLPWVLDWLALELLSVPSVLLCVKQLQLSWVLDWLALELLSVLSVLLCVQQPQLSWVLDWLAL